MNSVIYINSKIEMAYEDGSLIGRIKDKLKICLEGESFIKEIGLSIAKVKLPPNFNKEVYMKNMDTASKLVRRQETILAPKTCRRLDYFFYNNFQKDLLGFSVMKSIQLLLRTRHKSIKSSCIVVYDAYDEINRSVIFQLAKECRYLVLLSSDIIKVRRLSDYIIANFGVSPVVTNDFSFAVKSADFIITSKVMKTESASCIWYMDNMQVPSAKNAMSINDVSYHTPWQSGELEMTMELLGAILCQMEEKDIEESMKYNGIFLDKIKFNNNVLS